MATQLVQFHRHHQRCLQQASTIDVAHDSKISPAEGESISFILYPNIVRISAIGQLRRIHSNLTDKKTEVTRNRIRHKSSVVPCNIPQFEFVCNVFKICWVILTFLLMGRKILSSFLLRERTSCLHAQLLSCRNCLQLHLFTSPQATCLLL